MSRLRVAVWSPLPPSPSGVADYVAEALPAMAAHVDLQCVVADPAAVDPDLRARHAVVAPDAADADLHLYHLGNSPAHAYVYRAALARPGVAVMHEWSLHHLVLCETVERGDTAGYLREMRRGHGQAGTLVGRQVSRALGGTVLPSLYALNDRVLEGSLGVVGLTAHVSGRAARRLPGRPVLHLRHHLSLPLLPVPERAAARAALGLPADALVVTAPGLATGAKRLDVAVRAVGALRARYPGLLLVVAGEVDPALPLARWAADAGLGSALRVTGRLTLPDFERHLAAADVVLCLRFPSHGEISGALVRALGVGRPALVTGGSPAADEFPEGVVVPVDPGRYEAAEAEALLGALLGSTALRERVGRLARELVAREHDLARVTAALCAFLAEVHASEPALLRAIEDVRRREPGVLGYLMEEVRWSARDLGLPGLHLGLQPLLGELVKPPREAA